MSEAKRILVIDDEEIIHASLRRILVKQGYEMDNSLTVKDAFEKLAQNSYDLIITDLMMPEMNGLEFLEELKKRNINTPAVMITGYPTIKTAVQATRLGAVDYISKPFTRTEILSPINRALRRLESGESLPPLIGAEQEVDWESGSAPPEVQPGDKFLLSGHSWALFLRDGVVAIGVNESFLNSIDEVTGIETPDSGELIEQGLKCISLKTENEAHDVFAPVSGQVLNLNDEVIYHPEKLGSETWVFKLLPSQMAEDIKLLRKIN